MTPVGVAALAMVAAQLAASAVFQFAPFRSRLLRLDFIGLLPRWRFFVPDGGGLDHAIAIRRRRADATLEEWRTLWENPVRGRWGWLWSPDIGGDQHLWLAAATLAGRAASGRGADETTSHAYALILARCRREAGDDAGGAEHQFALIDTDRDGARRIGFVSGFHAP